MARTDSEIIWGIPGFNMNAPLAQPFSQELEAALLKGTVTDFLDRWKNIWLLDCANKPDHVRQVDLDLANGNFSFEEALGCLRISF